MNCSEYYMNLPKDLAGSMSKNRFRNEILWGLSKIYDIYDKVDDFFVVFDYVCDIEIHYGKALEFYQIKTNKNLTPYTKTSLTKLKNGKSILGKLFLIKENIPKNEISNIKIAIVSNVFFDKYKSKEILKFTECEDNLKIDLIEAIRKELKVDEISLNNSYYIYTPMNLISPTDDIFGKTIKFFCKVKGCDPIKPNVLFSILKDKISEKACYELECEDYENLILKKGFTKKELNEILDKHITSSDDIIIKCKEFIKENYTSFIDRTKITISLARNSVIKNEFTNKITLEIIDFMKNNEEILNINNSDVIDLLHKEFKDKIPLEYSDYDKIAFIIMAIIKYEEAIYE